MDLSITISEDSDHVTHPMSAELHGGETDLFPTIIEEINSLNKINKKKENSRYIHEGYFFIFLLICRKISMKTKK